MRSKNLLVVPLIIAAPFLKDGKAQKTLTKLTQEAKKEIPAVIKNPLDSASVYKIKPDSINFADTLKLEGIEITSTKITKPPKVEPKTPPKSPPNKKKTFFQQVRRDLSAALDGRPSYDLKDENDGINLQIKRKIGDLGYILNNQASGKQQSWALGVGAKKSGDALTVDGVAGVEYVKDTLSAKGKAGFFGELFARTQPLLKQYSRKMRENIFEFAIGTKGSIFVASKAPTIETNSGAIATFRPFESTTVETMAGFGSKSGEVPGLRVETELRQKLMIDRKGRSRFDIFARFIKTLGRNNSQGEVGIAMKVN